MIESVRPDRWHPGDVSAGALLQRSQVTLVCTTAWVPPEKGGIVVSVSAFDENAVAIGRWSSAWRSAHDERIA